MTIIAGSVDNAGYRVSSVQPMCRGVARGARVGSERRVAGGAIPAPAYLPGILIFISEILCDLMTRTVNWRFIKYTQV